MLDFLKQIELSRRAVASWPEWMRRAAIRRSATLPPQCPPWRSPPAPMAAKDYKISRNEVAVDQDYYWRPMATCPKGVKVQLLNPGKVAVYGTYNGYGQWLGWAPLPKIK